MKDIRKIKKYANILINTSKSSNQNINIVIDNLLSVKKILKSVPELRYLLSSKRVSLNDKVNSIKNIFNDYYGPIGIGSIIILIESGAFPSSILKVISSESPSRSIIFLVKSIIENGIGMLKDLFGCNNLSVALLN